MGVMSVLTRVGLRRPLPPLAPIGLDRLQRDWTYHPSAPDAVDRLRRLRCIGRWRPAPAYHPIMPITRPQARWIVYFAYLPDGRPLNPAHHYTLTRLRAADAGLLVICAAPRPGDVPRELRTMADALYWKGLSGFDFSAYARGLHEIAAHSPGADVLVINDSTYGPFAAIDTLWSAMAWDLTGFTACGQVENHVQSYAFHLKAVTPDRLARLADILPAHRAYDDYEPVVMRQETRFAATAAQHMSVGALWYAAQNVTIDPSLFAALPLVEAGFPFLKRGLLTKHAGIYPEEAVRAMLARHDHRVDGIA